MNERIEENLKTSKLSERIAAPTRTTAPEGKPRNLIYE